MFEPDALLDPQPFADRLRSFVDQARVRLGVQALAVATLAAPTGRVDPIWLAGGEGPPPSSTLLRQLLEGPAVRSGDDPAVAALGGPFSGRRVVVLPLVVTPSLAPGADSVALLAGGDPPQSALEPLRRALERGLSADRRARLAELIFAGVEQAADAIELTDREARLMYANPAWEEYFGHRRGEVMGRTVGSLFRDPVEPLHDPAFYQFTLNTLREGLSWLGTLGCRTADGGRVFCEVQVSPVQSEEPAFQGNFAVRRDTRHRTERDEALAIAHREFRSVLAVVPDGVAVLRDGRIYYANPAFLALIRQEQEEVIGRRYLDFVHPEDRALVEEPATAVSRVRMVPRSGPLRIAETSTAGSVSFEGVPATILLSRDVTDHWLAQEQLARSEKLSALGSLAAGVAHEINNPLAYVLLNLELLRLRRSAPDPEGLEALRAAMEGARRIQRLVTELRGFSGSDGTGPPEPIDVTKAVSSALNIAQNEIRHRAQLVREHEDEAFALAREGPLVQVLVNVLVNAAQAIPELGGDHQIRVRSVVAADEVRIAVTDTGVGIPSELLERLFDPFSTTKRRGKGTGLGLAISKRIVEGFGGRISVESEVGRGTTVTIHLPTAPRPAARPVTAEPPMARSSRPARRARVLVVDDERSIARALTRMLGADHDVVTAHEGRAALALLTTGPLFDVILCDLMMPGMPGEELYRQVCAVRPELGPRFVFMTGGAFTEAGSTFLSSLGSRVLVKPFDPTDVLRWVEEAARSADDSGQ